jgi:hypothetical protein
VKSGLRTAQASESYRQKTAVIKELLKELKKFVKLTFIIPIYCYGTFSFGNRLLTRFLISSYLRNYVHPPFAGPTTSNKTFFSSKFAGISPHRISTNCYQLLMGRKLLSHPVGTSNKEHWVRFLGVKRPGRGFHHAPPPSTDLKKE